MKKEVLIISMLFVLSFGMTGCSNDEGNELPSVPTDPIELTTPEEKPFVGVTYMEDSVKIQLQLLNSDSVAMDTFKEGEDIIFKLTISNTSSDWVQTAPMEKFSGDIFSVYSSDGVYIGKPWDQRLMTYFYPLLTPKTEREQVCSWLEVPDEDMVNLCLWLENPVEDTSNLNTDKYMSMGINRVIFLKKERRQPLPKGSYYTQFDVSIIEGRTTTIKMGFNVE